MSNTDREGEGGRIVRATGVVSGMGLVTRLVGYIQARAIAHYFGTTVDASAFRTATLVFDQVFRIGEELLTHSLLPTFAQVRDQRGEREAWKLASITANLQILLLIVVAVLVYFGAPRIVSAYSGVQSAQGRTLTVQLLRIMIPAVTVMGLSSLTYVVLNAYKRFALPALGDVLFKLGIVIAVLAVCPGLSEQERVYALAFGVVLGACGKLGIQIVGLRKKLSLYQFSLDLAFPPLKRLGALMLPLVIGILVSKVRGLMDNRFAWQVTDSGPAALGYARTLFDIPVQVVPYALGIALFPFLSEWALRGETKRLAEAFLGSTRMMLFLFVPLTVGALILSQPMIRLLYETGKFGAQSVALTIHPYSYYALGMLTAAMEIIVLQLFFSLQDTRTPVVVGLGCVGVHVALLYLNVDVLGMSLGGIALALTLSKTLKVVVLIGMVRRRIPEIVSRGLGGLLAKVAVASAGMALTMQGTLLAVHAQLSGTSGKLMTFGLPVVAGTGVFFVLSGALGIEEMGMVSKVLRRRLGARHGVS